MRAALDHLTSRRSGPVIVLGTCSGAYLAFQAICADDRLAATVLVNPYRFDVKPGTDIEAMIRDAFRGGVSYAERARQGRFWRRILRGEIRPSALARAVWRNGRALIGRRTARLAGLLPGRETVTGRIAQLRRRGARLSLIYCAGDMSMPALRAHLGAPEGRRAARLGRQLGYPITVLEGVDHNLSLQADQDRLFDVLTQVVRDAGEPSAPPRAARQPARGQGETRVLPDGPAVAGSVPVQA